MSLNGYKTGVTVIASCSPGIATPAAAKHAKAIRAGVTVW